MNFTRALRETSQSVRVEAPGPVMHPYIVESLGGYCPSDEEYEDEETNLAIGTKKRKKHSDVLTGLTWIKSNLNL